MLAWLQVYREIYTCIFKLHLGDDPLPRPIPHDCGKATPWRLLMYILGHNMRNGLVFQLVAFLSVIGPFTCS